MDHTSPDKTLLENAKKDVRKSSSFTFYLAHLLIPSENMQYFYFWYAYFRWVDDNADSNELTIEERHTFIEKQIALAELISTGGHVALPHPQREEIFLKELLFKDRQYQIIKPFVIGLLKCIQFDAGRINKYQDSFQLESFFNQEVLCYLNTFQYFLCYRATFHEVKASSEGNAGKWVHVLRDLRKDFEEKIINVPREDIERYSLVLTDNLKFIDTNEFRRWVKDKVIQAEINFESGKVLLRQYPNLRYKLLVILLCFKYQQYLKVFTKDEYILKRTYSLGLLTIIVSLPGLIAELIAVILKHRTAKIKG